MKNILVVNINWLGDAVFSTPVFKALKDNYPDSHVACLCVPRVKHVLEHCSYIDEFIILDEKRKHFWPWKKWALVQKLRCKAFDAAFVLHRSATRALLVYLAGIPQRIGYSKAKGLLTHPVEFKDEGIHRSDVYLNVLRAYGLKIYDTACRLEISNEDVTSLDRLLEDKGIAPSKKIVVMHVAGNWDLKRWPPFNFVNLIESLSAGVKIVLSGGAGELEYCQSLNQQAGNKALVIAGETTLGQSLALYKRAAVVVSSDSGPLHLAHSVGANVVGVYGPTRPEITGPRGTGEALILFQDVGCNKTPCYHLACQNNVCMKSIAVSDVQEAVQKFLS